LTLRLAADMGRARATALVKTAVEEANRSGRSLADVVATTPELASRLADDERADLFSAASYLGSAEAFRVRLRDAAAVPGSRKY
jgi:adenylosuccinate lyase